VIQGEREQGKENLCSYLNIVLKKRIKSVLKQGGV